MRSLNQSNLQNLLLKQNQINIVSIYNVINQKLLSIEESLNLTAWNLYYEQMKISLNDLSLLIEMELNTFQTSVLFLKSHVIHPYLLDHNEIITHCQNKMGYELTAKNIEFALSYSKINAIASTLHKSFYLVIRRKFRYIRKLPNT